MIYNGMQRYFSRSIVSIFVIMMTVAGAGADTLDRLRNGSPELRLGYRTDAAPFASETDGQPAGFTIDLCKAIAERVVAELTPQPVDVVWAPVSVSSRFEALQAAQIDILCGATTANDIRRETMSFTVLTYQTDAAILVNAQAFENDNWGQVIGVLNSTTSSELIEQLLTESGDGFAELRTFADRDTGISSLRAGEIDSFFGDRAILQAISNAEPGHFVVTEASYSPEPYAIALRLGDTPLQEIANAALLELFSSGEIKDLHRTWFGGQELSPALQAIYQPDGAEVPAD